MNNKNLKINSLPVASLGELRDRFLNRQWVESLILIKEGYTVALTMSSGHTHVSHPVYYFVKPLFNSEQAHTLEQVI